MEMVDLLQEEAKILEIHHRLLIHTEAEGILEETEEDIHLERERESIKGRIGRG
jgi:hypothetical protein